MPRWRYVLTSLVIAPFALMYYQPISDPDFWWHLATGRWMVEHGKILTQEIFSHTHYGEPWINFEWLAQWIYYWLFQRGGFQALVILKAAIFFLIVVAFYRLLSIFLIPYWVRLLLVLGAVFPLGLRGDLRPENFTLLASLVTLLVCEQTRQSHSLKMIWVLPFVMLCWINLHGAFVIGPLIVGVYWIGEMLARHYAAYRMIPAPSWRPYGFCLATLLATSLFNPFGILIWFVPLFHNLHKDVIVLIREWQRSQLVGQNMEMFWAAFFISFGVFLLRFWKSRSIDFTGFLLFTVFGFLAAQSVRHVALFCLLGFPVVLKEGTMLWREMFGHKDVVILKIVAVAGVVLVWIYSVQKILKADYDRLVDDRHYPVYACSFLERHPQIHGRLLNEWGEGGYINWRLAGSSPVFFDGRYLFIHDLAVFNQSLIQDRLYKDFLKLFKIELVLATPKWGKNKAIVSELQGGKEILVYRSPVPYYLPKEDWALVFWDDRSLIFLKRQKKHEKFLERYEYRLVDPFDEDFLYRQWKKGKIPDLLLRQELRRALFQSPRNRAATMLWKAFYSAEPARYLSSENSL